MTEASRITPETAYRILGMVNIGHAALALSGLVLLVWSLAAGGADAKLRFGSVIAMAVFTGLYFYTAWVRRVLCRAPRQR